MKWLDELLSCVFVIVRVSQCFKVYVAWRMKKTCAGSIWKSQLWLVLLCIRYQDTKSSNAQGTPWYIGNPMHDNAQNYTEGIKPC